MTPSLSDQQILATALASIRYADERSIEIPDLRSLLFPEQLALIDGDDPIRAAHPPRRSGKTTACAVALLERGLVAPHGSLALYLTLTGTSAREIVWPIVSELARSWGLGQVNESTMGIQLHTGARVLCAGTDDLRRVSGYRGVKLAIAIVDECQSQPQDLLRYLVVRVLSPAAGDLRAPIILVGTPPETPGSYWDDMINPALARHRVHHWPLKANLHFPDAAQYLEQIRDTNGWDGTEDVYLREYLGYRAHSTTGLVLPLSESNLKHSRLPAVNDAGAPLSPSAWRFLIGVDLGARPDRKTGAGTLAITLLAVHPYDRHDWVIATEKYANWIVDDLVARVETIRKTPIQTSSGDYVTPTRAQVIADLGGLGVSWADEAQRRFGLTLKPAVKPDRKGAIRWVHDRAKTATLQILDRDETRPLRAEAAVAPWDDSRTDVASGYPDHAIDSLLYTLREARSYSRDREPADVVGTAAWVAAAAKRHELELEERLSRGRRWR